MKKINWWMLTTFLMGAVAIVSIANEHGKGIAPVPPEVAAVLQRLFPGYGISYSYSATEDNEKILRIRLKGGQENQNVLAKVSMEGDILDVDDDKDISQIPPHIMQAFRKGFPKAEITHAEKGTRMEVSYRFDIIENGKRHEVKITRRGKIFEVVNRE